MVTDGDPFADYSEEDRRALNEAFSAVADLRRKISDLATVIELDRQFSIDATPNALDVITARATHARTSARHLEKMAEHLERVHDICRRYQP